MVAPRLNRISNQQAAPPMGGVQQPQPQQQPSLPPQVKILHDSAKKWSILSCIFSFSVLLLRNVKRQKGLTALTPAAVVLVISIVTAYKRRKVAAKLQGAALKTSHGTIRIYVRSIIFWIPKFFCGGLDLATILKAIYSKPSFKEISDNLKKIKNKASRCAAARGSIDDAIRAITCKEGSGEHLKGQSEEILKGLPLEYLDIKRPTLDQLRSGHVSFSEPKLSIQTKGLDAEDLQRMADSRRLAEDYAKKIQLEIQNVYEVMKGVLKCESEKVYSVTKKQVESLIPHLQSFEEVKSKVDVCLRELTSLSQKTRSSAFEDLVILLEETKPLLQVKKYDDFNANLKMLKESQKQLKGFIKKKDVDYNSFTKLRKSFSQINDYIQYLDTILTKVRKDAIKNGWFSYFKTEGHNKTIETISPPNLPNVSKSIAALESIARKNIELGNRSMKCLTEAEKKLNTSKAAMSSLPKLQINAAVAVATLVARIDNVPEMNKLRPKLEEFCKATGIEMPRKGTLHIMRCCGDVVCAGMEIWSIWKIVKHWNSTNMNELYELYNV